MNDTYTLADGRQLIVTPRSAALRDINGNHLAYIPHEHVEYAPTVGEQYLMQRGVSK
jgi:hypothetical protein